MYQYFIGFIRFREIEVAVAAAACMGGPPHCSHSNIFFANVDISKVLATFFVNAEARAAQFHLRALLPARTPTVKDLFGEFRSFTLQNQHLMSSSNKNYRCDQNKTPLDIFDIIRVVRPYVRDKWNKKLSKLRRLTNCGFGRCVI